MPRTLPGITDALKVGTPVQRRLPETDDLRPMFGALEDLAADDRTITRSQHDPLVDIVNPLVRFAGPYVRDPDYWNYSWTNISEHLTEPDPTGGSQRTLLDPASAARPHRAEPRLDRRKKPSNGEPVVSGSPMNLPRERLHGGGSTPRATPTGPPASATSRRVQQINNDPNLKEPSPTGGTGARRSPASEGGKERLPQSRGRPAFRASSTTLNGNPGRTAPIGVNLVKGWHAGALTFLSDIAGRRLRLPAPHARDGARSKRDLPDDDGRRR